ncbi:LIC12162 family protein [Desulfovibrio sp. ZJ200]|uniref:LIC12162 family transferase n=1 Tax=Desulfovibrio sp. ZJ200 TaxID=2709792 RepID=UPI0013EB6C44|nr:LIC12162 family protein [Desulfovibrio sp. ZJ200]
MVTQYLCSALVEARRKDAERYYVPEYPVYLAVCRDVAVEKLICAQQVFSSRSEVESAIEYINAIYPKILSHFAERLTTLHQYGNMAFWKRAMGLNLSFFIEAIYTKFFIFQKTFVPSYTFNLFSTPVPSFHKLDDMGKFLFETNYGNEYLFTKFIQTIFQNLPANEHTSNVQVNINLPGKHHLPQSTDGFCKYSLVNLLRKLLSLRSPTVGLLGTGISTHHAYRLTCASLGKIQSLYAPIITFPPRKHNIALREALFTGFPEESSFCRFLKTILIEIFPTLYLENFADALAQARSFWENFPNLKYIINEDCIGYSLQSFLLAVAHEERHLRVYINEHNGFLYPFLNTHEDRILDFVDKFLTGGRKTNNPNMISLGRLRHWYNERPAELDIDALYIDAPYWKNRRQIDGSDTFAGGANLVGLFTFFLDFFSRLSEQNISRIMYRPHPLTEIDVEQLPTELQKYIRAMRQADPKMPGTALLARSRLTIYAYTNSGYVEALHNNKPCIVFYDPSRCFLSEKHADFFDALIEAGIVVQTPQAAAERLTQVIDDPQGWWQSASVQRGRKAFLDKNLGDPKALFDYLVRLART